MITIKPSPTADTRSCDYKSVTKDTLEKSSRQHIMDVTRGLFFFRNKIEDAARIHDYDKITNLDQFHADFITGFESTIWWDEHRKLNRHHLTHQDGIPSDVDLIDILDFIADCVMAGMARSGSVYPLELPAELLNRAFQNRVELLKSQVRVSELNPTEEQINESAIGSK